MDIREIEIKHILGIDFYISNGKTIWSNKSSIPTEAEDTLWGLFSDYLPEIPQIEVDYNISDSDFDPSSHFYVDNGLMNDNGEWIWLKNENILSLHIGVLARFIDFVFANGKRQ